MSNALKTKLDNLGLTRADFPAYWSHGKSAVIHASAHMFRPEVGCWEYGPRRWWLRVAEAFDLHPLVYKLVYEYHLRPMDWHLMLLEWPHVSEDDQTMIAYTRTEEAGRAFPDVGSKRLTKTTVGKYIARHYPHVPDHLRRDLCALYAPEVFELWTTKEEIICGIELGPQSCMKSSYGNIPFSGSDNARLVAWYDGDKDTRVDWNSHPYAVYAPEYGWKMAVRLDKGKPDEVLGRALVLDMDGFKGFVRSYARTEGYSSTDTALEAWLHTQGYRKHSAWPDGAKLRRLEHPHRDVFMVPYIDGDTQKVADHGPYLTIDCDGDYECTNTDGTADHQEDAVVGECDCCGDTVYDGDDERIWAGRDEDTYVCGSCARNYQYVRGASRRGSYMSYYVHEDDAVEVNGNYYDSDNLPDYIVYSDYHDQHYNRDDVVWVEGEDDYYEEGNDEIVEIDGHYYRKDDEDCVVYCVDEKYRLRNDCWQSAKGNWYSDDETQVDVKEGTYHPDELQEMIDNA